MDMTYTTRVGLRQRTTAATNVNSSSLSQPQPYSKPTHDHDDGTGNQDKLNNNNSHPNNETILESSNNNPVWGGLIKLGITFFGEKPDDKVAWLLRLDVPKVDTLIVMGTSLSMWVSLYCFVNECKYFIYVYNTCYVSIYQKHIVILYICTVPACWLTFCLFIFTIFILIIIIIVSTNTYQQSTHVQSIGLSTLRDTHNINQLQQGSTTNIDTIILQLFPRRLRVRCLSLGRLQRGGGGTYSSVGLGPR